MKNLKTFLSLITKEKICLFHEEKIKKIMKLINAKTIKEILELLKHPSI